jgi:hypothetical protein
MAKAAELSIVVDTILRVFLSDRVNLPFASKSAMRAFTLVSSNTKALQDQRNDSKLWNW